LRRRCVPTTLDMRGTPGDPHYAENALATAIGSERQAPLDGGRLFKHPTVWTRHADLLPTCAAREISG
jgi:hypothetical protein